jgi:uncharacterized membrane protein YidH (DUF202 family)
MAAKEFMLTKKFGTLINKGLLTKKELDEVIYESESSGKYLEELLLQRGIPKHEILFCLSEYYEYPFVEYNENIVVSCLFIRTRRLDMERLKHAIWFPLSVKEDRAVAIAYRPDDPLVIEDIKTTMNVDRIDFLVALPSDIVRIIENNFDVNPVFPPSSGRTPLAMVRTFLAEKRSRLSCYRTSLAKGRTGLAFLRTGISFIAIAVVFFRIFGIGYLTILEAGITIAGIIAVIDGLTWYIPARKTGRRFFECASTEPTWGTTVLEVSNPGDRPVFTRTNPVNGASDLRADWSNLSPVMRRRFFAIDRTDLAEERTTLAAYRTLMARARTGLAFTRSGIALIGIGIALLRQFHASPWITFDAGFVLIGIGMAMEGFYWYLPGRRAGIECFKSVRLAGTNQTIWDFVFPPAFKGTGHKHIPPVKASHSPGIWGTTGLALERTLLAERRNVMARLRTVMARSRTGMSLIRTGMSISAVGMGFLVYFGTRYLAWTIFDIILILLGLMFIGDGLYWHIPAENIRKQFPYCYGNMDIIVPDYGKPACRWTTAVFSQDDI